MHYAIRRKASGQHIARTGALIFTGELTVRSLLHKLLLAIIFPENETEAMDDSLAIIGG